MFKISHRCSSPRPYDSSPHKSVLILFSDLSLGLPSCYFRSRFIIRSRNSFTFCPMIATCSTLIIRNLITLIYCKVYKSKQSSLYRFLKTPVIVCPSGVNILPISCHQRRLMFVRIMTNKNFHTHTHKKRLRWSSG